MPPVALTPIELGEEASTLASWSKEQVNKYIKGKNSVGAFTGHYTRRRTAWNQALNNWRTDPYSEIIKEIAIAAREECLRAHNKLEDSINVILIMGIVTQHYNTLLEQNANMFADCEGTYMKLFVQLEKEMKRKAEQAAAMMRDETEERMKENEQRDMLEQNRTECEERKLRVEIELVQARALAEAAAHARGPVDPDVAPPVPPPLAPVPPPVQ